MKKKVKPLLTLVPPEGGENHSPPSENIPDIKDLLGKDVEILGLVPVNSPEGIIRGEMALLEKQFNEQAAILKQTQDNLERLRGAHRMCQILLEKVVATLPKKSPKEEAKVSSSPPPPAEQGVEA